MADIVNPSTPRGPDREINRVENEILKNGTNSGRNEVMAITEYFTAHQLENFFVKMLIAVGKIRPDDPYLFMHRYLEENTKANGALLDNVGGESKNIQDLIAQWHTTGKQKTDDKLEERNINETLGEQQFCDDLITNNVFKSIDDESEDITRLLSWDNDVLACTDQQLMRDAYILFDKGWNITNDLAIEGSTLQKYIASIQANYIAANPYHNFKHAFTVLASVGILLREGGQSFLDAIETFSALISGMTHDVGHPGMGSDYYVKAGHKLAIRYNDIAVLENMHASLTFEIMKMEGNNILKNFTREEYELFRKTSVSLILSTDMKVHFDLTSSVQEYIDKKISLDPEDMAQRTLYQRCLVHAGDLSNPILPAELCKQWAYNVVLEFHGQATKEKEEGLPFSPFMEHHPDNTLEFAGLQVGFCSFVVKPFWTALALFYQDAATQHRLKQLENNVEMWNEIKAEEEARLDANN